jgi:hypothetical protein
MLAFFLVGTVAVLYGVALFSTAAAWIVFGLLCLAIALWPVLRQGL